MIAGEKERARTCGGFPDLSGRNFVATFFSSDRLHLQVAVLKGHSKARKWYIRASHAALTLALKRIVENVLIKSRKQLCKCAPLRTREKHRRLPRQFSHSPADLSALL